MNLTLLIFSLLARKPFQMTINEYAFNKKPLDLLRGYDQRYLINNSSTEICQTFNVTELMPEEKMYNFKKMFAQLALLNYIKRNDESEINKLRAIENHEQQFNDKPSEYKPNLLNGGLFKDWDFDMDK